MAIFGPLLDDFLQWLHERHHYTLATISVYLNWIPPVSRWFQSRKKLSLDDLTSEDFAKACRSFQRRHAPVSQTVKLLERFLGFTGQLASPPSAPLSAAEAELDRFAIYLAETRGLAKTTIRNHSKQLRAFLKFLQFDRFPARLDCLARSRIEDFLRHASRTNNRFSLQHVVATLRTFLRWRHARGLLRQPLHLEIDRPRVYRGERLPRALPWTQVQALLESIDQSSPCGMRDFALLYLASAYGLRSVELVRLTLDDIDWRKRVLQVRQTKTRRLLQIPLTNEAANILIRYLRRARPSSVYRHVFLRAAAPRGPLQPTALRQILVHRLRRSGLEIPPCGMHALRHSFAMRLLQQGVTPKAIGDALGHRDLESTSAYIRLDVQALREVALPLPSETPASSSALASLSHLPRTRMARQSRRLPAKFQSRFAPALQRYVDLKRALGRKWRVEYDVLRRWDHFVHREYSRARQIRAEMFTGWTQELAQLTPTSSYTYQRIIRNFLLFHARDHVGSFVPDLKTLPKPVPALSPRLVSEIEMGRILAATGQLVPTTGNPLRAETVRIGLLLLFCCGLRRGELLRLRLGDLEEDQTVLRVRQTKFYKSRLVPLSPGVAVALKRYLEERRRKKLPMAADAFLLWSGHRGSEVYGATNLCSVWHQLCVNANVLNAQKHPPRLHDLRHSFAVNALRRWYAHGIDVQAKLPHLATYLGHASLASTHYYLKLTPEIREAASARFHVRCAVVLPEGGVA